MKKRFLPVFFTLLLLPTLLTGCDTRNEPTTSSLGNKDQTSHNVALSVSNSKKNDNSTDSNSTDSQTNSDVPNVYMTSDISPEGLVSVYEALDWTPTGKVAVKLSTGEPPASNYLDPQLIKDVVEAVEGTIVECNTAYGGSRSETAMHYQVAEDHGFTEIADFQILDENGSMTLPIEGGSVLTENYVGAAFGDYDSYLVLCISKVIL